MIWQILRWYILFRVKFLWRKKELLATKVLHTFPQTPPYKSFWTTWICHTLTPCNQQLPPSTGRKLQHYYLQLLSKGATNFCMEEFVRMCEAPWLPTVLSFITKLYPEKYIPPQTLQDYFRCAATKRTSKISYKKQFLETVYNLEKVNKMLWKTSNEIFI